MPDDDYGYWYSDDSSASEELPFHTVNWDLQNKQNVSREKSSEDICMLCFTNERTHIFVHCGHLVCCTECIQRLEHNRCPVCNTTYEKYFRVRKP